MGSKLFYVSNSLTSVHILLGAQERRKNRIEELQMDTGKRSMLEFVSMYEYW
jgi:hypothetical protein